MSTHDGGVLFTGCGAYDSAHCVAPTNQRSGHLLLRVDDVSLLAAVRGVLSADALKITSCRLWSATIKRSSDDPPTPTYFM